MEHAPETIQEHGLTLQEYDRIVSSLGREPNLLELGIFSVMWSEHCSYKSSRRHLAKLPTKGERVIHGPGENAGVVDIGDGQAVIFKMESHNHPSFIEPYQGAATGVGGIMRDVFTMGARPVAMMNALRFGSIGHPKTKHLLAGVVSGIGGYGNCMGVPTVGGETNFDPAYDGNILVNAMCVGIADQDKIFLSAAEGAGNPVVYVGSKTGRDGIHGATMASAEFDDASEEKRPTVQVGDPFTEKLLLEACLELMAKDAILAIQDMGAAGLTSSSVEMAAGGIKAGAGGFDMDLDQVPQREEGMTAYEMMLSESQERMLMVLKPGREDEARAIFDKWGVDFAVIGTTTDSGKLVIRHKGEVVADLPVGPLADEAPNYDRPHTPLPEAVKLEDPKVVVREAEVTLTAGERSLDEVAGALIEETLKGRPGVAAVAAREDDGRLTLYARAAIDAGSDVFAPLIEAAENLKAAGMVADARTETAETTANLADTPSGDTLLTALARLAGSPDLCSREWIWSQYDHTVMGDTVEGPGGDAAVVRVHGTDKSLAISTDVTPRYCLADPKMGGRQAVAESYRNLCAVGAEPLAITNCLNFGNPEKPEIMAQFVGCLEGITEACEALTMPVVSGNVSLYNETSGKGIPPTPAIGAVGLIGDVAKAARMDTARPGDALVAIGVTRGWLGQSLYLRELFSLTEGAPPPVDLAAERKAGELVRRLIESGQVAAVHDVSDGGILVAAAEMAMASGEGLALTTPVKERRAAFWFGEDQGRYLLAVPASEADSLVVKSAMAGVQASRLGVFGGEAVVLDGKDCLSLYDLAAIHAGTLPALFEQETDPMPMAADDIKTLILEAMPDAEVQITDLAGDGDHYKARIESAAFEGLNRVQQHQLVYRALKGRMGGELHALALETAPKSE
ncbi:phosphoribosylformylglycinamidine synthase subunit PurL [Parvularcula dongshanensis]|uniref:Phosphoribosylformylglycinamidine synthase subunit PurL n=1 Tax=Parvularcula dongshanensis TaxID=1173995 RepID=A0A840I561_9PROT|nr:phosphoribosylformylglycinamidine synthase subunit PurL [Parvularcula dongshanensis]MBB4659160.1 phosphoribosylformylglycinamidine synthase [Parvularcula dongshanensis]